MNLSSTVGITRKKHKRSTTIVGYSICIEVGIDGGGGEKQQSEQKRLSKVAVDVLPLLTAQLAPASAAASAAALATKQMLSIHHLPLCCCHKFIHLFSGHDYIIISIMMMILMIVQRQPGQTIILRWSPIRLSKLHLHCNGRPIKYETSLRPFIKSLSLCPVVQVIIASPAPAPDRQRATGNIIIGELSKYKYEWIALPALSTWIRSRIL